LEQISGKD